MTSLNRDARIAGLIYLAMTIVGPIGLVIVPGMLLGSSSAAVTVQNIAAHESLFRVSMLSDLATGTLDIFVALALYRLLSRVDKSLAVLMVILGLMSTPIYFANTLNDAGALLFAHGSGFLSAFSRPQQEAMSMVFLRLHHYGVVVNEVFWGLWLLPFGMLVYKSGFLPRILGLWLVVNGVAYVAQDITGILWPQYGGAVANIAFPLQFGEVAIMLWLIVMGAKEPKPALTAAS